MNMFTRRQGGATTTADPGTERTTVEPPQETDLKQRDGRVAGGYAAGRMARFDGLRQGIGVWLWGIVVAGAIAILAVAAGSKYNVLDQLNLPRIPAREGTLTQSGTIALIAGAVASLVGAIV